MLIALMVYTQNGRAAELGIGAYAGGWAIPAAADAPPGYLIGGRLRYRWSDHLGVELLGGRTPDGYDPQLEFLVFAPNSTRVTPFLAVGGGALVGGTSPAWLAGGGGGVDAELVPWLDFRTDLRIRVLGESTPSVAPLFTVGLQLHTSRVHDADGDGVSDKLDGCPSEAEDKDGFQDQDGCPDRDNDGDGIADPADACVDAAEDKDGFEDADGCPDADNDKDGVADSVDGCPGNSEDKDNFEDADGCPDPDNDKDRIADAADACPDQAETPNGYRDADGCPDEVPAEVARFSGVIAGVKFETGKAVLLPSSSKVLDDAAAVLVKFGDLRLEVQGHTDDVGDDAKNLALSLSRAQSVVAYLVGKGVPADRLIAKGYGETEPKVPNDSAANRAINRRVEFKRL